MKRAALVSAWLVIALFASVSAQQLSSGKNVNVAGGPTKLDASGIPEMGDPYLQRQNEPSMACSSRNPLNCLAGGNDYRRLNFPGVQDGKVTGDAWLGAFWTRDGGNTWRSSLLPGYAEDPSDLGKASPAYGFEAGADPMVRPGTNGLFYYSGIAFNRGAVGTNTSGVEGKDGVMFLARYIDDNNTQTIDTPFRYLGASAVAYSSDARFLDKPALAVDIPRAGSATCTIPGSGDIPSQSFPGGHVYVAYAAFMGDGDDVHTKIQFHRSTDCGQTWSAAMLLSESSKINQSPSIAIDPQSGRVYVAWREFAADKNGDRILVAVSTDLGKTFAKGVEAGSLVASTGGSAGFDQPTLPTPEEGNFRLFRTNSYPTMCVAGNGTAYVAWAQRGMGPLGEARIMYSTSPDGTAWGTPVPVEPLKADGNPYNGHQFMPALACAGDKVTMIWYDQRGDALAVPELPLTSVFGPFLLDSRSLTIPTRTLDVRAAHATAGGSFEASVAVTRYPLGVYLNGETPVALQLQFSLENLPLFAGGVVPFIGDYIDVAPATVFQPITTGGGQTGTTEIGAKFENKRRGPKSTQTEPNGWSFNTSSEGTPPFHAIWTDNRDVVAGTAAAPIDHTNPPCTPGTQAGSKNQNIYTTRLSTGLVAGVLGNARPLGGDMRAFSVFVQNLTPTAKTVELRIANQPIGGGTASFTQFRVPLDPELPADPRFPFPMIELIDEFGPEIPPFSAIARTVFVAGSGNSPIRVDVDELRTVEGTTTVGQQLFAMINPDPTNPAPLDPNLRDFYNETHDSFLALSNIESFLNPTFLNPNFLNPNFLNPNFLNPNFLNPTFLNPTFLNPNFLNPNFLNPNFLNPTFLNPTFLNPTFLNPTFLNTTITEITWDITAEGNTSSSYLLALLSSMELPPSWQTQLLIYRVYLSPWGSGFDPATGQYNCALGKSEQHDLLTDVLNPNFLNPTFLNVDFSNPNFLNTALSADANNATFSLASGESAKVVLRVAHDGGFQPSFVTAVAIPEAVDTADAAAGITSPFASPSAPPAPLAFAVDPNLPATAVGTDSYSATVAVTGGTGPYTWQDQTPQLVCRTCVPVITRGIPPGLQLDPQTGVISGTPTEGGTWVFQIGVTDSSTPGQSITGSFAIVVVDRSAVGGVTDPAGDATLDLLSGDVSTDGTNMVFTTRYGAGFDPTTSRAQFSLDTDQLNSTGHPGINAGGTTDAAAVGSDFLVNFNPNFDGQTPHTATVLKYAGTLNEFTFVGSQPVTVLPDGYTVTIPLSMLDGDDGQLNYKVTSSQQISDVGSTGILDVMPDAGLAPGTVTRGAINAQQSVRSGPNVLGIGGDSLQRLSQGITPTATGLLTEVRLPIPGCGTLVVEIQTVDDTGGPTGKVLGSQTFSGTDILSDPAVFKTLAFATPVSVTAGVPVAIVLSSPDSCSISLGPVANFYDGGDFWFDAQPNEGWVQSGPLDGRYDLPFQAVVGSRDLVNGNFETGDLTGWTVLRSETELQQQVVDAPAGFVPPLAGKAYRIRPGSQSVDAGLSQTVTVTPDTAYDWSVAIAAQEFQNPGDPDFPLGTFELRLNGTVVATVTYNDANPHTQTFSGTYTPTGNQVEIKLVFNRGLSSFTAHPQWFADNVVFTPSVPFIGAN